MDASGIGPEWRLTIADCRLGIRVSHEPAILDSETRNPKPDLHVADAVRRQACQGSEIKLIRFWLIAES